MNFSPLIYIATPTLQLLVGPLQKQQNSFLHPSPLKCCIGQDAVVDAIEEEFECAMGLGAEIN